MMNINEALLYASTKFKKVNNIVAALDARLLLAYALDKPYEYLLLNSGKILTTDEQERFLKIVNERERLKPLAYILKYKEFYSRNFKLNDNVLIPRSDTETIIDAVLSSSQVPSTRILELGCGSGCIIISLLLEMPKSRGVACDISVSAIDCTVANAQKHNVDSRLEVIKSF